MIATQTHGYEGAGMIYKTEFETGQVGKLTLASDGDSLVGCWFQNDHQGGYGVKGETSERRDELPLFEEARDWFRRYFAGERPGPRELPLAPRGSAFQLRVWKILMEIPYGHTVTYGDIATRIASETGGNMSAQAVGGAVGRNPICIIIPCHRVVGAKGNLTGFGGGLATKIKLLEHEHVNMGYFHLPKKVAAWDGSI